MGIAARGGRGAGGAGGRVDAWRGGGRGGGAPCGRVGLAAVGARRADRRRADTTVRGARMRVASGVVADGRSWRLAGGWATRRRTAPRVTP